MHAAPTLGAIKAALPVITAVVGLVGALITVFRTTLSLLTDRSLERRARKHTEAINESLTRLRQFRAARVHLPPLDLDPYRLQLFDDLQKESRRLAAVREQQAEREALKASDPEGYRRWLLLYRPDGVAGWIVHSLFYGFLFVFFALIGIFVVSPPSHRDLNIFLLGLLLVLELVLPALYFRSAALRRRHLKVLLAKEPPMDKPKVRLPWQAKLFRWVKIILLWDRIEVFVFQKFTPESSTGFTLLSMFKLYRALLRLMFYALCASCPLFLYLMLRPPKGSSRFLFGYLLVMSISIAIALRKEWAGLSRMGEPSPGFLLLFSAKLDRFLGNGLKLMYYSLCGGACMVLYVMLRPGSPPFFFGFLVMLVMLALMAIAVGSDASTIHGLERLRKGSAESQAASVT